MKLGRVTKLGKRNKTTSKHFDDDVMLCGCKAIASYNQFTANLEQSRNRIPDASSVKLIFSSTVTFYLTKTENRTNKSLT